MITIFRLLRYFIYENFVWIWVQIWSHKCRSVHLVERRWKLVGLAKVIFFSGSFVDLIWATMLVVHQFICVLIFLNLSDIVIRFVLSSTSIIIQRLKVDGIKFLYHFRALLRRLWQPVGCRVISSIVSKQLGMRIAIALVHNIFPVLGRALEWSLGAELLILASSVCVLRLRDELLHEFVGRRNKLLHVDTCLLQLVDWIYQILVLCALLWLLLQQPWVWLELTGSFSFSYHFHLPLFGTLSFLELHLLTIRQFLLKFLQHHLVVDNLMLLDFLNELRVAGGDHWISFSLDAWKCLKYLRLLLVSTLMSVFECIVTFHVWFIYFIKKI